ncbi:MAG: hypothetical protein AAGH41_06240 [Pseudomonadota bacterium]
MPDQKSQKRAPAAKGGLSLSDLGSALAVVLSIAALGVSLLEASTAQRAAEAQVWPYIEISPGYNSEGFSFSLENKGVGPARVRYATLYYAGAPMESIDAMLLDILGPEDTFGYERYRANDPTGMVVSAREEVNLFSVDWDPVTRRLSQLLSTGLEIEACYCSVYDRCWTTSMRIQEPVEVASCPTPPVGRS